MSEEKDPYFVEYMSDEDVLCGGFRRIPLFCGRGSEYRINARGVVLGRRRNRILKVSQGGDGYLMVALCGRPYRLGRLLCESFHGPCPSGGDYCVVHMDGRMTSDASRVRWGTRKEARAVHIQEGKRRAARLERRRLGRLGLRVPDYLHDVACGREADFGGGGSDEVE